MAIGSQGYVRNLQSVVSRKIKDAKRFEDSGELRQSAAALREAAKTLREMADHEVVQRDRMRRFKTAKEIEAKAKKLDQGKKVFTEAGADPDESSMPAANEYQASVDELIYRSPVKWDDIAGMEDVKTSLKYTLGLMLAKMPDGTRINVGSRILLFGPPGTGKTLLAAACSNMLGATFFNVKASNLLSKWFGESTQLISALFSRARSIADTGVSVVFIDEFDGLCRTRGESGETGAERRILSTLLAELEGISEKGEGTRLITIAATNSPWDIDEAVRERFNRAILVDLPDQKAREQIFRIHTLGAGLKLEGVSLPDLAKRTKKYSGRLIERVCRYAIDNMVPQANPDVPKHVEKGTIEDYEIAVRPLNQRDFEKALKVVRPSTSDQTLKRMKEFALQYGGERA